MSSHYCGYVSFLRRGDNLEEVFKNNIFVNSYFRSSLDWGFILFGEPYFWMLFFLSTESKETSEILYWCIQIYGGAEVSHLVKFGVCFDDKFRDAVWKMKSEDLVFIQEKTVRKMLSSKEVNVKIYLLSSDYLLCICYISISIHLGNRIS